MFILPLLSRITRTERGIIQGESDQIYRNRKNIKYCKDKGIRLFGPKLGRPQANLSREEEKLEYKDNTDRIEVERSFSLSKTCYGLGLIKCKLEDTTYSNIGVYRTIKIPEIGKIIP